MTTCLGKSCSFGLPRVPFVNCCQYMYSVFSYFPFGFEGRMWDLIVSVPDHCLLIFLLYTERAIHLAIHLCCVGAVILEVDVSFSECFYLLFYGRASPKILAPPEK